MNKNTTQTALDALRAKKRTQPEKLTAAQQVILDAYYKGFDADDVDQILLANDAAEELRAKDVAVVGVYDAGMADGKRQELAEKDERNTELETALRAYRLDHRMDSYIDDCFCDLCQQAEKALKGKTA